MPDKPIPLQSMPRVDASPDGLTITFEFKDTAGRSYVFSLHPAAVPEIVGRLMVANRQASEGRRPAAGAPPFAAAYPIENAATAHSKEQQLVILTLDLAKGGRLEFSLSPDQAERLSSLMAVSAAKVKPPTTRPPH